MEFKLIKGLLSWILLYSSTILLQYSTVREQMWKGKPPVHVRWSGTELSGTVCRSGFFWDLALYYNGTVSYITPKCTITVSEHRYLEDVCSPNLLQMAATSPLPVLLANWTILHAITFLALLFLPTGFWPTLVTLDLLSSPVVAWWVSMFGAPMDHGTLTPQHA